jgi:hypothetical protein
MADKTTDKPDTVLVPPAGVHTPGRVALGDESPYVEAPADAEANPEAAREAYLKAQRGEHDVALPAGVIPQNADGSAKTPAEADEAVKDERQMQDYIEGKADEPPAAKRKG